MQEVDPPSESFLLDIDIDIATLDRDHSELIQTIKEYRKAHPLTLFQSILRVKHIVIYFLFYPIIRMLPSTPRERKWKPTTHYRLSVDRESRRKTVVTDLSDTSRRFLVDTRFDVAEDSRLESFLYEMSCFFLYPNKVLEKFTDADLFYDTDTSDIVRAEVYGIIEMPGSFSMPILFRKSYGIGNIDRINIHFLPSFPTISRIEVINSRDTSKVTLQMQRRERS